MRARKVSALHLTRAFRSGARFAGCRADATACRIATLPTQSRSRPRALPVRTGHSPATARTIEMSPKG